MRATIGADVAQAVLDAKAADPALSGEALAALVLDRHGVRITRHAALKILRRHRAAREPFDPLARARREIVEAAKADARGEPALSVAEILARHRIVAGDGHTLT